MKNTNETEQIDVTIYTKVKISLDDISTGFKKSDSKVDFLHQLFCLLKEDEWGAFLEKCNETSIVSDWVIDNQSDPDYYLVYIPREMHELRDEIEKKISIATNGDLY